MNQVNEKRNGRFSSFLTQYQLSLFFVLTLALSALIATIAVRIGNENISILTVFTPTIVAFRFNCFCQWQRQVYIELFVKQTKQRFKLPWLFVAVLLFPILAVVAIALYAQFGGAPLTLRTTQIFPTNVTHSINWPRRRVRMAWFCPTQITTETERTCCQPHPWPGLGLLAFPRLFNRGWCTVRHDI